MKLIILVTLLIAFGCASQIKRGLNYDYADYYGYGGKAKAF